MVKLSSEDKQYLEDKSKVIRQLCKILHNKYHIKMNAVPDNVIGLSNSYYRDFIDERRKVLTERNLAKIEGYIFDLYEPILNDEMDINEIRIPEKKDYTFNL